MNTEPVILLENVSVRFSQGITLVGDVAVQQVPAFGPVLTFTFTEEPEPPEVLSTSLDAYGITPPADCTIIKNWSEHSTLAASLATLGAIEIVGIIENVGPHGLTASIVRPVIPEQIA